MEYVVKLLRDYAEAMRGNTVMPDLKDPATLIDAGAIDKIANALENKPKEFIICSAIHFNDGKKWPHQPGNIETGFVVAGRRHHNCFATLSLIGESLGIEGKVRGMIDKIGRDEQGFITNLDRFVNRREAMAIAINANQLINPALHWDKKPDDDMYILTSEDLYSEDLY